MTLIKCNSCSIRYSDTYEVCPKCTCLKPDYDDPIYDQKNLVKKVGHINITEQEIPTTDVIVNRLGRPKTTLISFTAYYGISRKQAADVQMRLSYHPAGYGFYSFDAAMTKTTWCCSDSCD